MYKRKKEIDNNNSLHLVSDYVSDTKNLQMTWQFILLYMSSIIESLCEGTT
jgi:hypothetical protein